MCLLCVLCVCVYFVWVCLQMVLIATHYEYIYVIIYVVGGFGLNDVECEEFIVGGLAVLTVLIPISNYN